MPRATISKFLLAAIIPAAAATLAMSAPAQAADADHGKTLFMKDGCFECHGTVGQGGAAGPALAPKTPTAEGIAKYIRNPRGAMPPYVQSVVSDADIADIQAYLSSVPKPKKPEDIPLLSGK
ncbi:MAG TPA: cytochrome c [Stellaceae bacterium]|nr:cytochrome c [Stellaceae bacterium]